MGNKVIYDKDGKPVGSIYESDKEALQRWNLMHGPTWGDTFKFFRELKDHLDPGRKNKRKPRWYQTNALWLSLLIWPLFFYGLFRRILSSRKK
jgi:hypothetical protein